MPKVKWALIDSQGAYRISTDGKVESRRRCGKKVLYSAFLQRKTPVNKEGYPVVNIWNRPRKIHQLILEAFIGPRPDGYEAAHLNGVRSDNRLENLKWVTKSENQQHRKLHGTAIAVQGIDVHCAKLSEDNIREIKKALKNRYHGLGVELAKRFKVTPSTISYINRGHTWKHINEKCDT